VKAIMAYKFSRDASAERGVRAPLTRRG
jgi:hypothetical protein